MASNEEVTEMTSMAASAVATQAHTVSVDASPDAISGATANPEPPQGTWSQRPDESARDLAADVGGVLTS